MLQTFLFIAEDNEQIQIYSISEIKSPKQASEGILQSPRGESVTEPTLTPSGVHERLNC